MGKRENRAIKPPTPIFTSEDRELVAVCQWRLRVLGFRDTPNGMALPPGMSVEEGRKVMAATLAPLQQLRERAANG